MSYEYSLNLILVGNTGVGKSCLVLDFLERGFRENHMVTVGVDFGTKFVEFGGTKYKVLLWDTAGQEAFNSVAKSYYKNALGVLLVYDITNEESFKDVEKWVEEIEESAGNPVSIMLVGNKTDMDEERVISYENGVTMAQERGYSFSETSAKLNQNVDQAFMKLIAMIHEKIKKGALQLRKSTSMSVNTKYEAPQKISCKKTDEQADKQQSCAC